MNLFQWLITVLEVVQPLAACLLVLLGQELMFQRYCKPEVPFSTLLTPILAAKRL